MTQENSNAGQAALMQIQIIPVTPFQQNCSLIWETTTNKAAFVDPGGDSDQLIAALEHFNLTLDRIWLTHGHLDHAGAAQTLKEKYDVPIEGPHKEDQWLLDDIEAQGAKYGFPGGRNTRSDRYLDDGDQLKLGEITFDVVHTPGHTPGHVVIYHQDAKIAFVGDVIFQGSVGRTDFPRGSWPQLENSIKQQIYTLPAETRIHCGHGPTTTVGAEAASNPFVRA